jgi:alkanesulfonate monooxygenase SsuD/methylene tetrahydromethanopterin reductase-like flavin-dependent oxidoreductase (luciferase family)
MAKQCATIDVLSAGRLLPAFGIGANVSRDWAALGLDFASRGARVDEALEIIARLWTGENLTFEGKHFHLSEAMIRPLPAQADLPLWIGGSSPAAIRRTARFGTGWQGGLEAPKDLGPIVHAIADAARANGRSIDADHYGVTVLFRFGGPGDEASRNAFAALKARFGADVSHMATLGDASDILARLADYVTAGVSKFVMVPASADGDDAIEQTRRLLKEVTPRVSGLPQ